MRFAVLPANLAVLVTVAVIYAHVDFFLSGLSGLAGVCRTRFLRLLGAAFLPSPLPGMAISILRWPEAAFLDDFFAAAGVGAALPRDVTLFRSTSIRLITLPVSRDFKAVRTGSR